mgnify:CR=1 FL=1
MSERALGSNTNKNLNRVVQQTDSYGHQDHTCKDVEQVSCCLPIDYDKSQEPWKYRHLTNVTLPWYYHFVDQG